MAKPGNEAAARRRRVQWLLVPVVVVTIGLGWRYPWLGFSVPIVMIMGLAGGLVRGRYVCGNLCPRGALWDRVLAPLAPKRAMPGWLRSRPWRWGILAALMGFMAVSLLRNPGDPMHWGRVFWRMCVVTTAVGLALAAAVHPRAWCSFCPMGTLQNALGGRRKQLLIDGGKCRSCALCERACPLSLPIVKHKDEGVVREPDCLRCSECVAVCPVKALSWPDR